MNTLAEPVPWCRSLQGRGLLSEVRKSDKKSIHYFRKFNKNILQRSFDTWLRRKSLCQWKAHTLQLTKVDIFAIGRTGLAKIPLRQEISISWQEIGGTHGGDNSRYFGQPGSCSTPSGTACHRGSVTMAGKPGSCSTKKVSWASHSRPTYCSSSSIIYIKRCLKILHSHCSSL